MRFVTRWNGFVGRIGPAGRSVENPDIEYEAEWWKHTPSSELWGAVRKNIISDRFSTKTAISAHI